jgi:alkaline phosphatase D
MEVLLFCLVVASASAQVSKIAFGSCAGANGQENPELFKTIDSLEPDAFIWLGDAVYADTKVGLMSFRPSEETDWRQKFTDMKHKQGYLQLRQNTRILGVWDDHDYGLNGGNKHHPQKELARRIYLEFLDEQPESPRWTRAGGIYEAYTVEPSNWTGRSIKVILLDARFSADEWGADGDTLGEEQWKWLENELKTPGDLTLIGNGIQIIVEDRFGPSEKWHPKSRERLYKLLDGTPGVILLSGDVHMSELMLNPCRPYPLYEVTSSGMTHTVSTTFGPLHLIFSHLITPYSFNIGHRVTTKNFSLLTVDWSLDDPLITISVLDSQGTTQLTHSFSYSSLMQPSSSAEVCKVAPLNRFLSHILYSAVVYVLPVVLLGVLVTVACVRRRLKTKLF